MNIRIIKQGATARMLDYIQCKRDHVSELRDRIEELTVRYAECCTPEPSSSSSQCTFFEKIGTIRGADPVIGGQLLYDIYGYYPITQPAATVDGTFPWPTTSAGYNIGYGAFVAPNVGPFTGRPSYELLWRHGRWQLYAALPEGSGNSTLLVAQAPLGPLTEQPPLGYMNLTMLEDGYQLQVFISNNFCPESSASSSSAPSGSSSSAEQICDCEDATGLRVKQLTGSNYYSETEVVLEPTENPAPMALPPGCFFKADVTWKVDSPTEYTGPLYFIFSPIAFGFYLIAFDTGTNSWYQFLQNSMDPEDCASDILSDPQMDSSGDTYQITLI